MSVEITGCKACDRIQAALRDQAAICSRCQIDALRWEHQQARRRKKIAIAQTRAELEQEDDYT